MSLALSDMSKMKTRPFRMQVMDTHTPSGVTLSTTPSSFSPWAKPKQTKSVHGPTVPRRALAEGVPR